MLRYLHSIMSRVEDIDEARIMPLLREHRIMDLAVGHLHEHADALKREGQLAGATFLALSIDTEDYETKPSCATRTA